MAQITCLSRRTLVGRPFEPVGPRKLRAGSRKERDMRNMAQTLKRMAVTGALFALALGIAVPTTAALADDAATDQAPVLEQNQKTATELDGNLETKVTLSFPGKREAEASDVVFVLDKSGASAQTDIYNQAKGFLSQISQKAKADGLDIKVGVVLFNKIGNVQQPLTDVITGYDDILDAMNSSVRSGTNMDAGLLAAKSILDADTSVAASNKHVILISDGATYLFCKNGDYTTPYTRSFGNVAGGNRLGGIWEWQAREYNTENAWKKFGDGSNFIFSQAMTSPEKLAEYLAYYKDQYQNSEKNWAQYDYEYTVLVSAVGTSNPIPLDVNAPCSNDVAYISADDTFQAMANAGYDMNVYFKNEADFDGSNFLKYLARNTNDGELDTDFAEIKAKLIDKISVGSTVEDVIGANFDFVNDPDKISLNVAGEDLAPVKIDETTYGFGKRADGTYRFTLKYTAGENEKLTFTLNEAAVPAKPVVLTYSEVLVNKPTEVGTHTLNVNEGATLYPVDGNGDKGTAADFPVPTVSYTVAAPEQKPEPKPEEPAKPSGGQKVTDTVKAAKTHKKGIPQTGDTFSIVPVIGLIVAGIAACVVGVIIKRRNR